MDAGFKAICTRRDKARHEPQGRKTQPPGGGNASLLVRYVPLSNRALKILGALPQGTECLFADQDGEPLSNMAMLECRRVGFGEDLTVHGFRSTFNDGIGRMLAVGQSWGAIQRATGCSRATIAKIAKRLKEAA